MRTRSPVELSVAASGTAERCSRSRETRNNIAPDLPPEETRILAATQGRLAGKAFEETVAVAAWKTKPSWFVVTADDKAADSYLEGSNARIGAYPQKYGLCATRSMIPSANKFPSENGTRAKR